MNDSFRVPHTLNVLWTICNNSWNKSSHSYNTRANKMLIHRQYLLAGWIFCWFGSFHWFGWPWEKYWIYIKGCDKHIFSFRILIWWYWFTHEDMIFAKDRTVLDTAVRCLICGLLIWLKLVELIWRNVMYYHAPIIIKTYLNQNLMAWWPWKRDSESEHHTIFWIQLYLCGRFMKKNEK